MAQCNLNVAALIKLAATVTCAMVSVQGRSECLFSCFCTHFHFMNDFHLMKMVEILYYKICKVEANNRNCYL